MTHRAIKLGLSWALLFSMLTIGTCFASPVAAQDAKRQEFYELRVYHMADAAKKEVVSSYLETALLPALERLGVDRTGVFTNTDDADDHSIWVLIPYQTLRLRAHLNDRLNADTVYQTAAKSMFDLPPDNPAYTRVESRLMKAFAGMPVMELGELTNESKPRIFELRIYESHNSDSARRKVAMFNKGEIDIMRDVKMAPVMYGETLVSNDVPNLVYMLSASDRESHEKHWADFRDHPEWDRMKKMKIYKGTVSKITNWFLAPTSYSQM